MATVQYPPFLPLPQRADQNMTQDTAWQTTQTAVGPLIITPITTDLKATWTLQWIFTLARPSGLSRGCARRHTATAGATGSRCRSTW